MSASCKKEEIKEIYIFDTNKEGCRIYETFLITEKSELQNILF